MENNKTKQLNCNNNHNNDNLCESYSVEEPYDCLLLRLTEQWGSLPCYNTLSAAFQKCNETQGCQNKENKYSLIVSKIR